MTDRAKGAVEAGVRQVRDATSDLAGKSNALQDQAASIVDSRAQQVGEKVTDLVGDTTSATREWLSDASTSVRGAASSGAEAAMDAAQDFRQRAAEVSDRAGTTLIRTIEQNPLLVAGVGLLIGGLLASALPRSEIEDSLVGEASSAAKKRAEEAASKGFELAKEVGGDVLEKVARTAGAEGLTTDALGDAASDIGQRVKRVAEAALTTAFDPDSVTESSVQGEYHG